jgi:diadenosine tetraphosphate (Ap4A) HIT family hydrolase
MHIENAADVKPEVWKSLGAAYKRLTKEYKLSGATLFMRSGNTKITGASVQHLHAQVIVGSVRKTDSKPIAATVGFQK